VAGAGRRGGANNGAPRNNTGNRGGGSGGSGAGSGVAGQRLSAAEQKLQNQVDESTKEIDALKAKIVSFARSFVVVVSVRATLVALARHALY
jgi:hypothetical protein